MALTPHELVIEAKAQIAEISCGDALSAAAQAFIIDVREYDEYAAGHLPGAVNIPRGVLEFRIGNQPGVAGLQSALLLYCKTGGRSALAAAQLQRMGYTAVLSLAGGFERWTAEGHPVESPGSVSFE